MPNINEQQELTPRMERILNEIISVLARYVNFCSTHEVPDYYQIFSLNHGKNDYKKHGEALKKMLRLFHEDNMRIVEQNVHDSTVVNYFKELCDAMPSIITIMTDPTKKEQYDAELKEEYNGTKAYCKDMLEVLKSNSGERFNEVVQFEEQKKGKIQNTYESLAKVIGINISKSGTKYGMEALYLYLASNYQQGFTREDSSRMIIESLDREQVVKDLEFLWGTTDLKEISEKTVNLVLNEKVFTLVKASIFTCYRYGKTQLQEAIFDLNSEYPSFEKFTDILGIRKELQKNIAPSEVLYVLAAATQRNKFDYFKDGLTSMREKDKKDFISAYIDVVSKLLEQIRQIVDIKIQRAK